MTNIFTHDVFLSYSSTDKAVVHALAKRLKEDGLQVWLDEWEIRPGDPIGLKIQEGLANSRALVLIISKDASISDWVSLEQHTIIFSDPINTQRRLIPLLLDDVEVTGIIKQFAHVDWRQRSDAEYAKLLHACQTTLDVNQHTMLRKTHTHQHFSTDLQFLQSLKEEELCEWVLIPIFEEMGYHDIRYTERQGQGKDILFSHDDPLEGEVHLCASVKISALMESAIETPLVQELAAHINQTLSFPTIDLRNGLSISISKIFVVTSFEIDPSVTRYFSEKFPSLSNKIIPIDGSRILALIKKHLPTLLRSLPNPASRYLYLLCQRIMDNPTLNRLGSTRPLNILDVYTGGHIIKTSKDEAKYISFALPDQDGSEKDKSLFSLYDVLRQHPYCVVIADVGAGKTTLLQKLILDIGGFSERNTQQAENMVPILFPLSTAMESDLIDFSAFVKFLADYLIRVAKFEGFSLDAASEYILLMDGFDELRGWHEQVERYIQNLADRFGKIVVTSRPSKVPDLHEPFSYHRLKPFDDRNIQEFLNKWFPDNLAIQHAIFDRISANPNLRQFCRTPLILTLYSLLAANSETFEQLPVRRTAIYEQIIQMLLGKWDHLRNVKNQFDPDVKQHLLEMIAYETHSQQYRTFSQKQLEKVASEVMQVSSISRVPERLINEILFRSSLIRKTDAWDYEFVHLSFQEYLAALRLSRYSVDRDVVRKLDDEWWKGCLIFYFGICRTMDGFSFSRKHTKQRGMGLRLIEFLLEADFTRSSRRDEIIALLGDDLLGSTSLSKSELLVCNRLGNGLINILDKIAAKKQEDEDQCNLSNYFTILRYIGTEKAIQTIWRRAGWLPRMELASVLKVLSEILPLLADKESYKFFEECLEFIAKGLKDYLDNAEDFTEICRSIIMMKNSQARWLDGRPIWKDICKLLLECIHNTRFISLLPTNDHIKQVCTAIITIGEITIDDRSRGKGELILCLECLSNKIYRSFHGKKFDSTPLQSLIIERIEKYKKNLTNFGFKENVTKDIINDEIIWR
jgi:hypothetical protein